MVWSMSTSQSGCVLMCTVGGGVVGSAEGREEVVAHQLTAHTARVNSTGGDKQEVLHVHTHTHRRMDAWTACTTLSSQCPHAHTKRHTSVTTHDKVIHVTFTHTQ